MKMFPLAPILSEFLPLYLGLHRIFDLMAKRQLFGFQLAQMHFGANAQVKESESKNLGGQIRRRYVQILKLLKTDSVSLFHLQFAVSRKSLSNEH